MRVVVTVIPEVVISVLVDDRRMVHIVIVEVIEEVVLVKGEVQDVLEMPNASTQRREVERTELHHRSNALAGDVLSEFADLNKMCVRPVRLAAVRKSTLLVH